MRNHRTVVNENTHNCTQRSYRKLVNKENPYFVNILFMKENLQL